MQTSDLAAQPDKKPSANLLPLLSGGMFLLCLVGAAIAFWGNLLGELPAITPTIQALVSNTPLENTSTITPSPSCTITPKPSPTATEIPCPPPGANRQTGTIVEIIDAAHYRVLIDGLTYRVKSLGLIAPLPGSQYFNTSKQASAELTAKSVTLISGPVDKDPSGSLLRYILAGDTFTNIELIKLGYAAYDHSDPMDANCQPVFQSVFDTALLSGVGAWAASNNSQFYLKPTLRVYYILPTETPFIIDATLPPKMSTAISSGTCCKVCGNDSQPCGDTCIALNKTCHTAPGCACK